MSKYVRTKYDILKYDEKEKMGIKPLNENHDLKVIFYPKIVKQADTIEELCDEFVLTWACQKRLHNTLQEAKYWHSQLRKK